LLPMNQPCKSRPAPILSNALVLVLKDCEGLGADFGGARKHVKSMVMQLGMADGVD
jgi:hypothetical protein